MSIWNEIILTKLLYWHLPSLLFIRWQRHVYYLKLLVKTCHS